MKKVSSGYCVYVMSSTSKTLYVGVTNNLERRVWEHKAKIFEGFTKRYNISHLVYFESFEDIRAAIEREKQIKGWLRKRKLEMISAMNPEWKDLSAEWFRDSSLRSE